MAYVLVVGGVVVQKQPYSQSGFIVAPDDVVCGYTYSSGTFSAPTPATATSYIIAKRTPWDRMTTDEAEKISASMELTDTRLRGIYDASTVLNSSDALWPVLHDVIATALGDSARADQLLAPET